MKSLWVPAILIPVGAAVLLGVAIVAVGELYLLLHGTGAVIASIVLMTIITVVGVFFSKQSESDSTQGQH